MDWIESSLQRVVGGSLTGTTNPMIYARVEQERLGTELGRDIFIFHTIQEGGNNREILENGGKFVL